MIKSALKIYRKNIWNIFAATGIVALGILVALIVAAPALYDLLYYNISRVMSAALTIPKSGFDGGAFLESITRQLNGLNWRDPINSVQSMLGIQPIIHLFKQALEDSGMQFEVVNQLMGTINQCANEIVAGTKDELIFVITCVGTSCAIAFISSRIVIQLTSTQSKNIKNFIITFLLNLVAVVAVYAIIGVLLFAYLSIATFVVVALLLIIGLLFLTFLWPAIFYRDKSIEFRDIYNVKTILWYYLAAFIVLVISLAIIGIAFLISDVIALVLALPLIFITNIIMENIAIGYTTNYSKLHALKPEAKGENKK